MNIITLDFETYFDSDYTLSKMTTEAYIRDPRFEVHGVGVRWSDNRQPKFLHAPSLWGPDLKAELSSSAVLCHHAAFDGLILSHHYRLKPARWLDTLSMAAYLFPGQPRSLEALAKRFGLDPKSVPYDAIRGHHWADMSPETQSELIAGCLHDCELTFTIFIKMMKGEY